MSRLIQIHKTGPGHILLIQQMGKIFLKLVV